jgi:hypothetical protein
MPHPTSSNTDTARGHFSSSSSLLPLRAPSRLPRSAPFDFFFSLSRRDPRCRKTRRDEPDERRRDATIGWHASRPKHTCPALPCPALRCAARRCMHCAALRRRLHKHARHALAPSRPRARQSSSHIKRRGRITTLPSPLARSPSDLLAVLAVPPSPPQPALLSQIKPAHIKCPGCPLEPTA